MTKPQHIYFLTREELDKFFEQIKSERDFLIFKLIYLHGLRVSELLRLEVKHLDFVRSLVYIQASKKGFKSWEALDREISALLEKYLAKKEISEGIIFDFHRMHIFRLYKNYATLANLPEQKRHPHCLRHTLAVHLARVGAKADEVQAMLRHKSISSTMIYYKIMDDQKQNMQIGFRDKLKDLSF